MSELVLTSARRKALKARAHGLRPVVWLGVAGLTQNVVSEIDRALTAHQLVKIKVPRNDRDQRAQIAADLAGNLSAANVLSIGKMIVLFRPLPETEEKQEPNAPMNRRQTSGRAGRKNSRVIGG